MKLKRISKFFILTVFFLSLSIGFSIDNKRISVKIDSAKVELENIASFNFGVNKKTITDIFGNPNETEMIPETERYYYDDYNMVIDFNDDKIVEEVIFFLHNYLSIQQDEYIKGVISEITVGDLIINEGQDYFEICDYLESRKISYMHEEEKWTYSIRIYDYFGNRLYLCFTKKNNNKLHSVSIIPTVLKPNNGQ